MMTISDAHKKLVKKEISAEELTRACLEQIEKRDGELHAYLEVFDDALARAKECDARADFSHPLAGIPLAIKDNILIRGKRCSSASKILETYVASYDAGVIARLKDAGAVFLGRTNMDEFAMGSSTENSAFGPTKNPHDLSRVPGGSSGGSAAAVAAGMALGALGSDTGGSIRQPASLCGIVGMKPTYGMISRSGLMAMASSLDQIGPLAATVEDAELLYRAIAAHDPMDSTSIPESIRHAPSAIRKIIGVPHDFLEKGLDSDVKKNFDAVCRALSSKGYALEAVSLPNIVSSLAVYYILMPAEASTNLARYDGMRYGVRVEGATLLEDYMKSRGAGFGREVRRRIILGTYVLSAGYYDAYYTQALKVRALITRDFADAFKQVDAILTPTSPVPAFKIGEKADDPLKMYLADIFTVPTNIAELPALSVPSGWCERDGKKLPLGVQITAPRLREDALFSFGREIESLGREV